MNEVIKEIKIENMIYEIRGKQVMLDSDLAKLYQCKNGTKSLNLAVKRNMDRFPNRFMFQLTKEELYNLRFQNETAKESNYSMSRSLPYAFTEQGVAMLATILKTDVSIQVSIQIMDAFVEMKKYISNELLEQKYINDIVFENRNQIKLLQESFNKLGNIEKNNHIFFEGQIYDAYSKIIDILNLAKTNLIIIDNYADKILLDMISKINTNIILITKENSLLSKTTINKYNKQYNNLKIIYNNTFHDRYIIIDENIIYHLGSSINCAGNKTFSINKLEDKFIIKTLINKINNIILVK